MFLVTGGAGFIGSNIVASLNEAGRTDVVVNDVLGDEGKWRNLAKRQIADFVSPADLAQWLEGRKLDAVIHMGAISDTTAALRASELHADIIMKATKVDGIYDKDPKKFNDAVKYEELTFVDALHQRLNVMDSTAFSLCLDNNVPILVFNLDDAHAIKKAVMGEKIGTLVHN